MTTTTTSSYFQLPAIPLTSSSLTDGTDIPPPPPSPPPKTRTPPPRTPNPLQQHPSTSSFALPLSASIPGAYPISPLASPISTSSPRPPLDSRSPSTRAASNTTPRNPTPSKRPNGIRKFLSLRSLNRGWASSNGHPTEAYAGAERPESPGGFSTTTSLRPSLVKKRSSFFFGRRRSSMMLARSEEEQEGAGEERENVRPGTPPPVLPEVEKLTGGEGVGGFLGGADMFRDIK